jgi:hypothetical protein
MALGVSLRPATGSISAPLVLLAGVGLMVTALTNSWRTSPPPAPQLTVDAGRYHFAPASPARLMMPDGTRRTVRSLLHVPSPMRYGDYFWKDDPAKPGAIWVRIDLRHQILSVFRGEDEIGTAVILYGADSKPTPTGDFVIKDRQLTYRSRTYNAPMPYMLRLTDDGVAIHAGIVRPGYATHGCIGVPAGFARQLFAVARPGDTVAILPDRGPVLTTG